MTSLFIFAAAMAASAPGATSDHDVVAGLDVAYQAAVKANDAETMDRILHPQFQLVLGTGLKVSRDRLIDNARKVAITYELQDEEAGSQSVIVAGDTAIVTAKLLLKGSASGQKFERVLWFSDTYVRTPEGWRYLFGQASLPVSTGQESAGVSSSGTVTAPDR